VNYRTTKPANDLAHPFRFQPLSRKGTTPYDSTIRPRRLNNEIGTLYALLSEGTLSKEAFAKRYKGLEHRQKQLEDAIPRLENEIAVSKINLCSTDEIVNEPADLYTRWPEPDLAEKREIVEAISQKIVVSKERVCIELYYIPPRPSLVKRWQMDGGRGGIRTPGTVSRTLDFESSAFNHSATLPRWAITMLENHLPASHSSSAKHLILAGARSSSS
jgi:hypothetical protein